MVALSSLALLALVGSSAASNAHPRFLFKHWLSSWATMPQLTEPANLPSAPFNVTGSVFANSTIRQSLKISRPGSQFRLRFSNAFSDVSLDITSVTVALPSNKSVVGTSAIDTSTLHKVTFSSSPSFSVPNAAQVVSDPIPWSLEENSILTISTYLANGQKSPSNSITSHPGSRTTSYWDFGDWTSSANMTGTTTRGQAEHWYFISGLEVETSDPLSYAVALVGDSITDGRGSTPNENNRWPDQLYTRLRARPFNHVSYLNQAAGGNRILADGLGPNALSRIDRDVLSQTRVGSVILFEGINDIGVAAPDATSQADITKRVIAAMDQIITRVHAQEKPIFGCTITPFGKNSPGYAEPSGEREKSRQAVNDFIRNSGKFDAVIDFDKAIRDPANETIIAAAYDSGDGLHPNPTGYKAMAEAVPLYLFP